MDIEHLERALAATAARPVLVAARLLTNVIRSHRALPGLGSDVPHRSSYVIGKAELAKLAGRAELGYDPAALPDPVVLLPRPTVDPAQPLAEACAELWRHAFHARVHVAIEALRDAGELGPARVRERIHAIGATEFDEARHVLDKEHLLVAPHDDFETFAELAAVTLELTHFEPRLFPEMFPGLAARPDRVELVSRDLDVPALLQATRPDGAELPTAKSASDEDEGAAVERVEASTRVKDVAASDARDHQNLVRAMLLDPANRAADAGALASLLDRSVRASDSTEPVLDHEAWTATILALAKRADAGGGLLRPVSARLLFDLQSAGLEGEKVVGKIDLARYLASLGRKPLTRRLPATRELRVANELRDAAAKVPRVDLPPEERERLGKHIAAARHASDVAFRASLRPTLEGTLAATGFVPENLPERVALAKLVNELLDEASTKRHLSLGQLRDAVSRNQLKMKDVSGARELVLGDPLLVADRRLKDAIDGVHRGGEIYLRLLQKMSSLLFGTTSGRFLTFFFIVPIGGAYLLPFAVQSVAVELAHLSHLAPHHWHLDLVPEPRHLLHATTPEIARMVMTGVLIFGLLHSATVRAGFSAVLHAIGLVLRFVLIDAPGWVFGLAIVRRFLTSGVVRALGRFLVRPGGIAAATYMLANGPVFVVAFLTHRRETLTLPIEVREGLAAGAFVVSAVALNTKAGRRFAETTEDTVSHSLDELQRHLLPSVFRLIGSAFRWITDTLDRGLYAVDEWLRFSEGQSRAALAAKAIFGFVWFAFAYVLRLYVNLLLEPTVNPIKHVPTVTVAAKIMLPIDKDLAEGVVQKLGPQIGEMGAGVLAGLVVVSLPGFFGFLVWELKENYKLYKATRARFLKPVVIGHHGETMTGLLRPGFHSGTLPKLWQKLRSAARKGEAAVEKHREALRELEEAVERFVDRELSALLVGSDRFPGRVRVQHVALAGNRIRVDLAREGTGESDASREHAPCSIAFEERSGHLVGRVLTAGFVAALEGTERVVFENALAGLYHRAGVDIVYEQVQAALPAGVAFDLTERGLVTWPAGFEEEIVYELAGKGALVARTSGSAKGRAAPFIEREAIGFGRDSIAWTAWIEAWSAAPKRLVRGAEILPAR